MISHSNRIIIKEPEEHAIRLVAVPSEQFKDLNLKDIIYLKSKENTFEILRHTTCIRNEMFSSNLFLLALGKEVTSDQVFSAYPNSESIIVFTVKKL